MLHYLWAGSIVPVAAGQTYYAEVWIALADVTSGAIYVRLSYYDGAGAEIAYADGNHITSSFATSGWHLSSVSAAAPSNAVKVRLAIIPDCLAGSYALVSDCFLRRLNDASLIVDGSISASKLVVGAAVADIETVGSLTAGVIYFTDGFCLNTLEPAESGANVTLNHVLSATAAPTSAVTMTTAQKDVTGLGWTVTTKSTSDVYNIFGNLCTIVSNSSIPSINCMVNVDGTTKYTTLLIPAAANSNTNNLSLACSLTGLSAGSHTIQIAMSNALNVTVQPGSYGTNLLLQRIY